MEPGEKWHWIGSTTTSTADCIVSPYLDSSQWAFSSGSTINFTDSKKEENMRAIYKVYVVDPRKQGKLLDEVTVIADSEDKALLKAGVAQIAEKAGLEIEDVDTFADEIERFIRPRKETQKVRVVKGDD